MSPKSGQLHAGWVGLGSEGKVVVHSGSAWTSLVSASAP